MSEIDVNNSIQSVVSDANEFNSEYVQQCEWVQFNIVDSMYVQTFDRVIYCVVEWNWMSEIGIDWLILHKIM